MESTWDIVCHAMIAQNVSSIVSQNSAHPWRPVWYFLGKTSWNPWNYWFSLFLLLYVTVYTCFRALVTQDCSSFMVGKCTVPGPPVLLSPVLLADLGTVTLSWLRLSDGLRLLPANFWCWHARKPVCPSRLSCFHTGSCLGLWAPSGLGRAIFACVLMYRPAPGT